MKWGASILQAEAIVRVIVAHIAARGAAPGNY